MPENGVTIGEVHILDIGLHADFYQSLSSKYILTDDDTIRHCISRETGLVTKEISDMH
jgi:hypothetical protein